MQWLRMASILLLWAGVCRLAGAADAGNAMILANMDRAGWPDALTTQANVDTASRAEVLMFGKALLASEELDEQGLKRRLGVRDVKLKSVRQGDALRSNGTRSVPGCIPTQSVGTINDGYLRDHPLYHPVSFWSPTFSRLAAIAS